MSAFFFNFFNAVLWWCSHISLKSSNRPLTQRFVTRCRGSDGAYYHSITRYNYPDFGAISAASITGRPPAAAEDRGHPAVGAAITGSLSRRTTRSQPVPSEERSILCRVRISNAKQFWSSKFYGTVVCNIHNGIITRYFGHLRLYH